MGPRTEPSAFSVRRADRDRDHGALRNVRTRVFIEEPDA
jgi:hypothetical protein